MSQRQSKISSCKTQRTDISQSILKQNSRVNTIKHMITGVCKLELNRQNSNVEIQRRDLEQAIDTEQTPNANTSKAFTVEIS